MTEIRREMAEDVGPIHGLLLAAFPTPAEAMLVERLRRDGDLVLSLIAADANGSIIGHAAFPRLRVVHSGAEYPAVGLAPLAVAEGHRRKGIGAGLVLHGFAQLRARDETLVFILGDPAYYTRFGFALDTATPFASAYTGPYFMALRLADDAPHAGTVRYPAAFHGLG